MYAKQAVVIGGGLSGLFAARVLSDHFEQVLVFEKDDAPAGITARKGVPQGTHVHGLQPYALTLMNRYYEGLTEDLVAAGAVKFDFAARVRMYMANGWLPQRESGIDGLSMTRPLLEAKVRVHTDASANIKLHWRTRIRDLVHDGNVVKGVVCEGPDGDVTEVPAALVIDASGRGTRLARWISDAGFPEPAVSSIHVDVRYATALYERPSGDESRRGFVVRHYPMDKLGAAMLPVEDDQWLLSLSGRFGVYPGKDHESFMASAGELCIPDIYETLKDVPATTDVTAYTFSHNEVRHFSPNMPAGLLPVGDTVIALNPLYGQGMTSAMKQADLLNESLCALGDNAEFDAAALTRRHCDVINTFSAGPWKRAVLGDTIFSEASGDIPVEVEAWREEEKQINLLAAKDPSVSRLVFEVAQFAEAPERLTELLA